MRNTVTRVLLASACYLFKVSLASSDILRGWDEFIDCCADQFLVSFGIISLGDGDVRVGVVGIVDVDFIHCSMSLKYDVADKPNNNHGYTETA